MASKRKLQTASLAHFGFVASKKVALRDEAASTVGPLPARTEEPLRPCQEDEAESVNVSLAECSGELAGPEVMSVGAASASDHLPAGWTMKQVDEWKDRNSWLDFKAGKLGCANKQKLYYSQRRDQAFTSQKNGSMVTLLALTQKSYERKSTNTGTVRPTKAQLKYPS